MATAAVNVLSYEPLIRLGCFGGVLLVMGLWEMLAPRRRPTVNRPLRWANNLGLVAVNTLAARFLVPLGAVSMALLAYERGWGVFNNVSIPGWLAVALSVVALDLAIYLQHVTFHAVPLLWRLHAVHHADLDFDATTGVRFHVVEIVLSLLIKLAAVALLGAPALAVLLFEVLLNATSVFNHGNVRLPGWLDRVLRLVVVTPEMHRVHHSVIPRETNSNFGFNLPWWDYLFGTYKAQPEEGHEGMTIGLEQVRDERTADRLHWMLLLPFLGNGGNYPIDRRGRPDRHRLALLAALIGLTVLLGGSLSLALMNSRGTVAGAPKADEPAAGAASAGDRTDFFARRIAPILSERCAACHNGDKRRGGLDLTSHESLLEGGDSGPAVVPGKPDEGSLLGMVSGDEPRMPRSGKRLTPAQLADLRWWIEAGAEWPDGVQVSGELWSVRPVSRPKTPHAPAGARQPDWVRTPVDAFILRRLDEEGLKPSPRADRATLIRRATFDLHGLPPTPEEIDDFLADTSADAFERVIDRLLASPRYGERWGRHWLDLAGYADSHGFELDYPRRHAWRYRDYVIGAFNDDTPYDQFLREQIAGDVLAPDDPSAVIATGFLAAGPWDYSGFVTAFQGTAASRMTRLVDLDNVLTTVMTTTVGLTVGCARCHDHKFDPIPQKDYYSLQAVFAGVRRGDRISRGRATPEQARRMEQIRLDVHKKRIGVAEIDALAPGDRTDETAKKRAQLSGEIAALQAEYARLPQVELTYAVIPETPPATHVLHRGDTESPKQRVTPAALGAVKGLRAELTEADAPEGERRIALARWLTAPANPLTARVMANRLWQHHFGRGIVGTPGDFGFNGERPSHPDLLDWLASEFQRRGWSVKQMHRLLMLSSTFQQATRHDEKAAAVDAGNRLLWRMNRRRLSAEEVRDGILAVSGQLDLTMGGPAFMPFRYQFRKSPVYDYHDTADRPDRRRSVYAFIVRSTPNPFLDVLDFPVPSGCTPARNSTTTALQSLSLLNDPFVLRQADHLASRLAAAHEGVRGQVKAAYRLALGREPSGREMDLAEQLIEKRELFQFCRALFNTNEFLYVD